MRSRRENDLSRSYDTLLVGHKLIIFLELLLVLITGMRHIVLTHPSPYGIESQRWGVEPVRSWCRFGSVKAIHLCVLSVLDTWTGNYRRVRR